jgi:putative inorganic carbon (HCO3(-)) transporter
VTLVLASTLAHGVERADAIVLSLLVAALLALPLRRAQRGALVAATLVLTPALLALALWNNAKLATLHHHPLRGVAAIAVVVVVVAALAHLIDRRPRLLPLLALATLPFRIPLGSISDGLLLPLYAVIAAGALVLLVRDSGGDRTPGALERLLALALVLYAIQVLYSPADSSQSGLLKAVENIGFFYVPFALLFFQLRRLDWTAELLRQALWVLFALAVLFALVGLGELADGSRLLFNASLDQDAHFVRINSLFYDPNIYGRFLALVMILLATATLAERRPRVVAGAAAALALMWVGLLFSLSESSMVALIAGLATATLLMARRRGPALAGLGAAALAAVVLAFVFASGSIPTSLGGSGHSLGDSTSGRTSLVSGGFDLFKARPLGGYGSGSFSYEYLASIPRVPNGFEHHEHLPYEPPTTSDSHATPITIAAEQGIIGLVVYLALLLVCFWRLLVGIDRAEPSRRVARIAIAAAFTGLVVHTLFYADFLEDPSTWALLAVGVALSLTPPGPEAAAA